MSGAKGRPVVGKKSRPLLRMPYEDPKLADHFVEVGGCREFKLSSPFPALRRKGLKLSKKSVKKRVDRDSSV